QSVFPWRKPGQDTGRDKKGTGREKRHQSSRRGALLGREKKNPPRHPNSPAGKRGEGLWAGGPRGRPQGEAKGRRPASAPPPGRKGGYGLSSDNAPNPSPASPAGRAFSLPGVNAPEEIPREDARQLLARGRPPGRALGRRDLDLLRPVPRLRRGLFGPA